MDGADNEPAFILLVARLDSASLGPPARMRAPKLFAPEKRVPTTDHTRTSLAQGTMRLSTRWP